MKEKTREGEKDKEKTREGEEDKEKKSCSVLIGKTHKHLLVPPVVPPPPLRPLQTVLQFS